MNDPFPINNARTRRVRPISPQELAAIMAMTKRAYPHPEECIPGASLAFRIFLWGTLPLAAAMILLAIFA